MASFVELIQAVDPQYTPSAKTKAEPMGRKDRVPKPPRLFDRGRRCWADCGSLHHSQNRTATFPEVLGGLHSMMLRYTYAATRSNLGAWPTTTPGWSKVTVPPGIHAAGQTWGRLLRMSSLRMHVCAQLDHQFQTVDMQRGKTSMQATRGRRCLVHRHGRSSPPAHKPCPKWPLIQPYLASL